MRTFRRTRKAHKKSKLQYKQEPRQLKNYGKKIKIAWSWCPKYGVKISLDMAWLLAPSR